MIELVEDRFPTLDKEMQADLVFVIKGFMKNYSELFLIYQYPVNLNELCNSLVEKTKILAEHASIPYIPAELMVQSQDKLIPTKEQLTGMLQQKKEETTDSIILESLNLLQDDLEQPNLSLAIIQGLLNNLRNSSHYKWVASLYELYLKK